MKRASLLPVLLLAGCATQIPVIPAPASKVSALQGSSLTTVTYEPVDFVAVTFGKALSAAFFGPLFTAGAAEALGNKIIRESNATDPSDAVAARLTKTLATQLGASATSPVARQPAKKEAAPAQLTGLAGGKGLVLDVKTVNWEMRFLRADTSRYQITYVVNARLHDAASGKLIAQVPCTATADSMETAQTAEQLSANGGEQLKLRLANVGTACAEVIEKTLFSAPG